MKKFLLITLLTAGLFFAAAQTPATPFVSNLDLGEINIVSFPCDIMGERFTFPTNESWMPFQSRIKFKLHGIYITGPSTRIQQLITKETLVNPSGAWGFSNVSLELPPQYEGLSNVEASYTLTIWHELYGRRSPETVYYLKKPRTLYKPPVIKVIRNSGYY